MRRRERKSRNAWRRRLDLSDGAEVDSFEQGIRESSSSDTDSDGKLSASYPSVALTPVIEAPRAAILQDLSQAVYVLG